MEKEILEKYQNIIANLKDGQTVKIKRQTVLAGDKPRPFGTLTRNGNLIRFEPAKRVPGYASTMLEEKAAQELTDRELLSAFSF